MTLSIEKIIIRWKLAQWAEGVKTTRARSPTAPWEIGEETSRGGHHGQLHGEKVRKHSEVGITNSSMGNR